MCVTVGNQPQTQRKNLAMAPVLPMRFPSLLVELRKRRNTVPLITKEESMASGEFYSEWENTKLPRPNFKTTFII